MAKKKLKKEAPAGPFGPVFLGIVSASLGALIAFFQLAGKTPESNPYFESVSAEEYARLSTPDAPVDGGDEASGFFDRSPKTVYFIRSGGRGGGGWRATREQLIAGGNTQIAISSAELNSWITNSFRRVETETGGLLAIAPATPILNITAGELHLYLPVTMSVAGREFSSAVIARGELEAGPGGLNFRPRQVYLGSSPLGGPIVPLLAGKLSQPFRESEEYQELGGALAQFSRVELSLNQLLLER